MFPRCMSPLFWSVLHMFWELRISSNSKKVDSLRHNILIDEKMAKENVSLYGRDLMVALVTLAK